MSFRRLGGCVFNGRKLVRGFFYGTGVYGLVEMRNSVYVRKDRFLETLKTIESKLTFIIDGFLFRNVDIDTEKITCN